MRNKLGQVGLIIAGIVIGVAISLNFSAVAQRESAARQPLQLPIEELRAFTEVFGRVKKDYVKKRLSTKLNKQAKRESQKQILVSYRYTIYAKKCTLIG